jgi:FkbM family methyltransferase
MLRKIIKKTKKKINLKLWNIFYKVIFLKPCYVLVDNLSQDSVVVDFGTGNDADFSVLLIEKYGLKGFGFDPTRKHLDSLKKIENSLDGKFKIHNLALSSESKSKIFYESKENVSGSFMEDHTNIKNDTVNSYEVEVIKIGGLLKFLNIEKIDLLKVDVEGEEYKVIPQIKKDFFDKVDQFIVEFHHHCLADYSWQDTMRCVDIIKNFGFKAISLDQINYLFFKSLK